MKVAVVVVTHNRVRLLGRAIQSIKRQKYKSNLVIIISNSDKKYWSEEKKLCDQLGFQWFKNNRTTNYAGALNTGIEKILEYLGFDETLYFASLDDDDEWSSDYLQELYVNNTKNYDLLLANVIRKNNLSEELMYLPKVLSMNDFLSGNPGVGGSNTFVRFNVLMKAGGFDEALNATVDRDIFVRIFQLNPSYLIVEKHLVFLYVENDRMRVTNNKTIKVESYQLFYYKYSHLMSKRVKKQFLNRAETYFNIEENVIISPYSSSLNYQTYPLTFQEKKDYPFIIGFIAGEKPLALRIIHAIIEKRIAVDRLIVINNLSENENFDDTIHWLQEHNIKVLFIKQEVWKLNLENGYYGSSFSKFPAIDSIPLGRTILQHHLYTETLDLKNPVYWIIDDDITFESIQTDQNGQSVDIFNIINQYKDKADALIGGVSQDPPLPTLSCIRGQLVDLMYSHFSKENISSDILNLRNQADYYYDLSDRITAHLEMPIYYQQDIKKDLKKIFSGKSTSRPCLQYEQKGVKKTVTNRGPNTLIFNKDLLRFYPVISYEVNGKFTRRGDLFWALANQIISNRVFIEHSFSINQNRPIISYDSKKELHRAAYDIIGYAFNKAILLVIEQIKLETKPNRPKDIFEQVNQLKYFQIFIDVFHSFIEKRKGRFIMNYYRIIGILEILSKQSEESKEYLQLVKKDDLNTYFIPLLEEAKNVKFTKHYLEDLSNKIWSYSQSITKSAENLKQYELIIKACFSLKNIEQLGSGSEGIVFTDKKHIYKIYFTLTDNEWIFLQQKSIHFGKCQALEMLEFFEFNNKKIIRYPFREFQTVKEIRRNDIVDFLIFCRQNKFIFTNIKPKNFIILSNGQLKLIDYGKSFEPFQENKFINTIKRAFLMLKNPNMADNQFRALTKRINYGQIPSEIEGWQNLYHQVRE